MENSFATGIFVVFAVVIVVTSIWTIASVMITSSKRKEEAKETGLPNPPVGFKWVVHNKGDGSGILYLLPSEWDTKLPSILEYKLWSTITFRDDTASMNDGLRISAKVIIDKFGSERVGSLVSGEHYTAFKVEK